MEIVKHVHAVNVDVTLARLESDNSSRPLSLTEAPSTSVLVKFGFSFLLWECSSEVVDVDSVELNVVIQHSGVGTLWEVQVGVVVVLCELPDVIVDVVLEVGILLKRVEQSNLTSLIRCQTR